MFRILNKIKLNKSAEIFEKIFINQQIDPSAKTSFKCCNCKEPNILNIIPYETGFAFLDIYGDENVLTVKDIIENKVASQTSNWAKYLGDYTVNDLPTLYFGTTCKKCSTKHFVVFGYGEKQQGLSVCEISGVWGFDYINKVD